MLLLTASKRKNSTFQSSLFRAHQDSRVQSLTSPLLVKSSSVWLHDPKTGVARIANAKIGGQEGGLGMHLMAAIASAPGMGAA